MISNRFFVTALDDGTTLHGNLSVDGSLSQAWNGNAAVPDWSTTGNVGTADQPTIMLTLLSGNTYIGTSSSNPNGYISEAKWYYNDNGADSEITFATSTTTITLPDGSTVTGYQSTNHNGRFLKHEKTVNGVSVPCLRIIQNLASDDNVDLDTISLKGKYNSGSGILDFQATAQVRISRMTTGGYLGVITFANGISDITQKNQQLSLTGTLYGSTDNNTISCKTEWYLNGVIFRAKNSTNTITVTETDVVDNAVVRCDFYVTKNNVDEFVASAYANIDDMQDTEYMYIQYAGQNGNAASLRKGQTADFEIWVGTTTNPAVDTTYAYFQAKLIDGNGNVITDSLTGINPVVADGWRNLDVDATTHRAGISIAQSVATTYGKNITGIVRASTTAF